MLGRRGDSAELPPVPHQVVQGAPAVQPTQETLHQDRPQPVSQE